MREDSETFWTLEEGCLEEINYHDAPCVSYFQ